MFAKSSLAATLVAALVSALAIPTAHAVFPNRPITMVVPLPAGGTADLLCRLAADKAGNLLGQQILVENRAGGAGGRVGTESVLRAPPDGYTLLCAPQIDVQHNAPGIRQCGVRHPSHAAYQHSCNLSADCARS
jgi:tripartite-type tricarboxylate transporter receptor subunit TctC